MRRPTSTIAEVTCAISSGVQMNGGMAYTRLRNGRSHTPRSSAAGVAIARSTGRSHSMTPMAPHTRTSVTDGNARAASRPAASPALIAATYDRQSWPSSSSTLATDTAQASGLAMNVGPCISAPASPELMVCATSVVHKVAARLR